MGLGDFVKKYGGYALNPPIASAIIGSSGNYLAAKEDNRVGQSLERERQAHERGMFEANARLQREFAKMGIRWKAEDAKAAGLHPLSVLGTNTASGSPIHVSGGSYGRGRRSPRGELYRSMGQNLSRAMMTMQTKEERAVESASRALRLKRMQLENELLQRQIDQHQKPAMPDAVEMYRKGGMKSQGNYDIPIASHEKGYFGKEKGNIPSWQYTTMPDGSQVKVASIDYMRRALEIPGAGLEWYTNVKLAPLLERLLNSALRKMTKVAPKGRILRKIIKKKYGDNPPKHSAGKGMKWVQTAYGTWIRVKK